MTKLLLIDRVLLITLGVAAFAASSHAQNGGYGDCQTAHAPYTIGPNWKCVQYNIAFGIPGSDPFTSLTIAHAGDVLVMGCSAIAATNYTMTGFSPSDSQGNTWVKLMGFSTYQTGSPVSVAADEVFVAVSAKSTGNDNFSCGPVTSPSTGHLQEQGGAAFEFSTTLAGTASIDATAGLTTFTCSISPCTETKSLTTAQNNDLIVSWVDTFGAAVTAVNPTANLTVTNDCTGSPSYCTPAMSAGQQSTAGSFTANWTIDGNDTGPMGVAAIKVTGAPPAPTGLTAVVH